jgi:hypothetical protein
MVARHVPRRTPCVSFTIAARTVSWWTPRAPGSYTLTFTLTGFNTFKRENIELSGSFTATINAEYGLDDRRYLAATRD